MLINPMEDPSMAYTMEEFIREARQRFLQEPVMLSGLSPTQPERAPVLLLQWPLWRY